MTAPLTQRERHEIIVEAAGGPEAWAAYREASEALHALARLVPGSLGCNVADVYKETTVRLERALSAAERKRGI